MPSEEKTPLGLNQWMGKDRPKMADFNTDNQIVDLACRSVLTSLSDHLEDGAHPSDEQRSRWDEAARHPGEGVATEQGMHGLRYFDGKLEVNVGGVWETVGSSSPGGEEPEYSVYGVCVDTADPDPAGAVTYTDDAVGMTPGGAEWNETFFARIRPCVLKGGSVQYYLSPDNYRLREDGAAADVVSGADGDVMVEVPKIAYAIYTEGDKLYVKVTDHPDAAQLDPRFCYNAHTRDEQGDRDFLYVGAYLGSVVADRLRSLSEKAVQVATTIDDYRRNAAANGTGYELLGFYARTLLQCLFLVRFKSRDSQTAVGMGCVFHFGAYKLTGNTDGGGMFSGTSALSDQIKVFGIEDLWGNANCFLDGVRTDGDGVVWTAYPGGEYRSSGHKLLTSKSAIQAVQGDNGCGFVPVQSGGDDYSRHWCDSAAIAAGCAASCGGHLFDERSAGLFKLDIVLEDTGDMLINRTGLRLMYL